MNASITDTTRAPTVGHYRIDPSRTTVRFSTRHLFSLGAVSGTVRLREADFSVTEPSSATVHAVVNADSFDTGNTRRDTDVRSAKYLDVAAYPDFPLTPSRSVCREASGWAVGTLTAHGAAAHVDLTLDEPGRDDDGKLILRASAKIDRYAHRVTAGKGLAGRWLTVEVAAVARRDGIDG
jgi:polyisoprenoid-binding protein YceI